MSKVSSKKYKFNGRLNGVDRPVFVLSGRQAYNCPDVDVDYPGDVFLSAAFMGLLVEAGLFEELEEAEFTRSEVIDFAGHVSGLVQRPERSQLGGILDRWLKWKRKREKKMGGGRSGS